MYRGSKSNEAGVQSKSRIASASFDPSNEAVLKRAKASWMCIAQDPFFASGGGGRDQREYWQLLNVGQLSLKAPNRLTARKLAVRHTQCLPEL